MNLQTEAPEIIRNDYSTVVEVEQCQMKTRNLLTRLNAIQSVEPSPEEMDNSLLRSQPARQKVEKLNGISI